MTLRPIHPSDQIHDGDRDELRTRVAAAIRDQHPDLATVRMLGPVTDVMTRTGRCGPAHLGKAHRNRLGAQLDTALAWLTDHGLLAGAGADRVWSRRLLVGLRLNQTDQATTGTADLSTTGADGGSQ